LFTNRKGVPLPTELPKSLIPPSKASLIVAPAASPVVEEKKSDDAFDFGVVADEEGEKKDEKKSDDAFDFGFGAPAAAPAPVEEKKDDAFDFGTPAAKEEEKDEKKDDAFDFGFGAPPVEEKKEEEEEKPAQPMMPQSQPQPPMMPPKPVQPQGQPTSMPQGQPVQPGAQPAMPADNDPFATTPQERGFYQQLFMQLDKDKSHLLPHDLVIGYHSQSGLPRPVLEKLFAMSDLDKDGKLDFAEFVIMTHILFTNRKGVPLPTELPKSLIPPSKASLIAPAPAPAEDEEEEEEEEKPAQPVMPQPPMPTQPTPMPAQPPMMPQGQPVQPGAQPADNDPFATTPQERGFYQQLFLQLDKDNSHLLPHDLVIGYHSQSGLPRPVLEKFWTSLSS
ncbi:hypothetical protein BLSTO_05805, partial [Blastocystis sp. subtype 1]